MSRYTLYIPTCTYVLKLIFSVVVLNKNCAFHTYKRCCIWPSIHRGRWWPSWPSWVISAICLLMVRYSTPYLKRFFCTGCLASCLYFPNRSRGNKTMIFLMILVSEDVEKILTFGLITQFDIRAKNFFETLHLFADFKFKVPYLI